MILWIQRLQQKAIEADDYDKGESCSLLPPLNCAASSHSTPPPINFVLYLLQCCG